jgi:hypothetical protein
MKAQSYKINLNKASNRLDQYENVRKRRRVVTIGLFFLIVLAGSAYIVYRASLVQNSIKAQQAELTGIEDKIAQLEASSEYLSPEDIFNLANVARGRLTWSEKLSILADILPRDIAITELTYDDNVKAFIIKGVSKVRSDMKDLDLVVSIIDILKAQPEFNNDFSEIKFQSSQRIKHNDQEIVRFEIACLLKA